MRVVIARAHKEGQISLKRCLETVLRAMNHECNFPSLPPQASRNKYTHKSYNVNQTNTNNDSTDIDTDKK